MDEDRVDEAVEGEAVAAKRSAAWICKTVFGAFGSYFVVSMVSLGVIVRV